MVAPAIEGIDLFKIAGRSISGWIPSLKTDHPGHVRQPFCSHLEERLLMWLEYNPLVSYYARGDIGLQFATTYRLPVPSDAPFAIGYTFEGKPHEYLPDVVGTLRSGKLFIAEAGMEDDKRGDRNLVKAEAARRLPNTSYGRHDASAAAQAGGMTLEELERCFYQAVVDDYQQAWDPLRRQRRCVLWEQAVAQSGVPRYLGAPDDLKLLLMKAVNRKTPGHGYRVQNGSRLSFHGRWYVSPGLLNRLSGREFEVYYDRRDLSVLYLFVSGSYEGTVFCKWTSIIGTGRCRESCLIHKTKADKAR